MKTRKFTIGLIVITLVLLALLFGLRQAGVMLPTALFAVIPAYALLTSFLFRSIRRSAEKSPARFVSAFMGAISIKLLVTVGFLAIYISIFKEDKVAIALSVFAIYISYTVLLVKELRNQD